MRHAHLHNDSDSQLAQHSTDYLNVNLSNENILYRFFLFEIPARGNKCSCGSLSENIHNITSSKSQGCG